MVSSRRLIAVLDDEESIRRALQRLFRSAGFEVQTFASGPEFLESLSRQQPGCLVLDIHMRGMTGFDVLEALQSRPERVPTIIITAFHDATAEPRALQAGAIRFMPKPIRDEDLLAAVEAALNSNSNGSPLP